MKRRKVHPLTFTAGGIGGIIGALIAQLFKGEFILAGFLGAVTAFVILAFFDMMRYMMKRKNEHEH